MHNPEKYIHSVLFEDILGNIYSAGIMRLRLIVYSPKGRKPNIWFTTFRGVSNKYLAIARYLSFTTSSSQK